MTVTESTVQYVLERNHLQPHFFTILYMFLTTIGGVIALGFTKIPNNLL